MRFSKHTEEETFNRKELVKALSQHLGVRSVYNGIHVAAQAKTGTGTFSMEPQQAAKEAQDDGNTAAESNNTSGDIAGDRAADHTVGTASAGVLHYPTSGEAQSVRDTALKYQNNGTEVIPDEGD